MVVYEIAVSEGRELEMTENVCRGDRCEWIRFWKMTCSSVVYRPDIQPWPGQVKRSSGLAEKG